MVISDPLGTEDKISLVTRKPSSRFLTKSNTASVDGKRLEIMDLGSRRIILPIKQKQRR